MLAPLLAFCVWLAAAAITPAQGTASERSIGTWRSAAAPIVPSSGDHTATLLKDGRVLMVGGALCGSRCNGHDDGTTSAELYDQVADRWTTTEPTSVPREHHTATLLRDGHVLVAGGYLAGGKGTFTAAAEIFSPEAGDHWRVVGSMRAGRIGHTATLLSDGRVLVAGGVTLTVTSDGKPVLKWSAAAELFDPATERWSDAAPLTFARADHTSTLLRDGKVFVAGGRDGLAGGAGGGRALRSAELYDPVTGAWTAVPHLLHSPRVNHTATVLTDGTVLLAGGAVRYYHGGTSDPTGSVEIYRPADGTLTEVAALPEPRLAPSATLLADGRVLVAGGVLAGDNVRPGLEHHGMAAPELYNASARTWDLAAEPMIADPSTHGFRGLLELTLAGRHSATLLPGGRVLFVGGDGLTAQVFDPTGFKSEQGVPGHGRPLLLWATALSAAAALGAIVMWRGRQRGRQ